MDALNNEKPHADESSPSAQTKRSFKFKVAFFIICGISVVVAIDSVIVDSILLVIMVVLNGTTLEAFWVGTSYSLAQTERFTYAPISTAFWYHLNLKYHQAEDLPGSHTNL